MNSESSNVAAVPSAAGVSSTASVKTGTIKCPPVLRAQGVLAVLAFALSLASFFLSLFGTARGGHAAHVTSPLSAAVPVLQTEGRKRRRIPKWLPTAAVTLISLGSLAISVATYYTNTAAPEVTMRLPYSVLVGLDFGKTSENPYIYVQASFVSTGTSAQVEVIDSLAVRLQTGHSAPMDFQWYGLFHVTPDASNPVVKDFNFYAEPQPLVVSHQSPQIALAKFLGPVGWKYQAGIYTVTVTAGRQVVPTPLVGNFRITISKLEADNLAINHGIGGAELSTSLASSSA